MGEQQGRGNPNGSHTSSSHMPGSSNQALLSVGEMLHYGWSFFTSHWRPALGIVVVAGSIPMALIALLWPNIYLVYQDPDPASGATKAALDKISTAGLVWLVTALLITALAYAIGYLASVALVTGADGNTGDRTQFSATWPALRWGAHRWLAYFGWWVLIYFGIVVAIVAVIILAVVNTALGVIAGIVAAILGFYVSIRWAFIAYSIADEDPHPFKRSASVSDGRFWSVFGHFLVIGLITFGIAIVLGMLFAIAWYALSLSSEESRTISAGGRIALALVSLVGETIAGLVTWWTVPAMGSLYRPRLDHVEH